MKKYIFLVLSVLFNFTVSCTSTDFPNFSYNDISIDLHVIDQKLDTELVLIIRNITNHPVKIPTSYIPSEKQMAGYFNVWEQYSFFLQHKKKYAIYKGCVENNRSFSSGASEYIVLPINKSMEIYINLSDIYEIPDDMNTLLFVYYEGYLGKTPVRTIDLCSPIGKHYFDVSIRIQKEKNRPVVEIKYKNISDRDLFLPKNSFIDDASMHSDFFSVIDLQGNEREYIGITGDRFEIAPFYGECVCIGKKETYVTRVDLASFYDISDCTGISVKIRERATYGESNSVYIELDNQS